MRLRTAQAKPLRLGHWARRRRAALDQESRNPRRRELKIALVEMNRLGSVGILRRVDAFKITMTAPISVGGIRSIGGT